MSNDLNSQKIIAVIVTHNRLKSLQKSVNSIVGQSLKASEIIIIDNANQSEVKKLAQTAAKNSGIQISYLGSETNLGGAGGFALGILTALSKGAQYIWLADDDGYPENEQVLKMLFSCLRQNQLDEVSPLVCDINNNEKLAFPLRFGLRWVRERAEIANFAEGDFLPNSVSLFNGALFKSQTFNTIGVPDYRLFIRGDEVEIFRRLKISGLTFGTCLNTCYLHPQGGDEFKPIFGGRLHAQYPDNPVKRFYTYRNRGFLLSQKGFRKLYLQEYIRFAWLFLINRKDPKGFINWLKLHNRGRAEKFYRYDVHQEHN